MYRRVLLWLLVTAGTLDSHTAEPDIRWRVGGHFIPVESVDFLPDGKHLISASADVDVKLWDVPSRRLLWTSAAGRFGQTGIALAPDGSFYIASATELGTNLVTQRLSGEFPALPLGHLRMASSRTAISPSGQRAAAIGFITTPALDRDLRIWNVATGTEIAALPADSLPDSFYPYRIEFLTEDDLAIGSFKQLSRWSVDGTVRWSRSAPLEGDLFFKAVSPDRSRLLVEEDRALKLLDSATGEPVWALAGDLADSWRVSFNADGTRFVVAFTSLSPGMGRLEIRATDDGALLRTLPISFQRPIPAFSPDGTQLACGHSLGIHVTSLAAGEAWESLTESSGQIRRIAVSSAGNWVAATADSSRVDLRRLDTGVRFRRLESGSALSVLAAAPDGTWLAFLTNNTSLVRYRPATDTFDATPLETGMLYDLVVSADGSRLIALGDQRSAWMIDPVTWSVTARPQAPVGDTSLITATWARDASRVTTTFGSGLTLTYAKDAAEPEFTGDWTADRISFMEYLPDGETILSLHRSGYLRRWRVTDGAILSEFNTGLKNASAAVFSPDRRLLLASIIGDRIRIFNTLTGSELDHWIRESGYQIRDLEISQDDAWLVNARLDGALVGSRAPFILYDARATPVGVEFSISGGDGPYQLQRRPAGPGAWTDIGLPFTGRTASAPYDGTGPWLYRLFEAP